MQLINEQKTGVKCIMMWDKVRNTMGKLEIQIQNILKYFAPLFLERKGQLKIQAQNICEYFAPSFLGKKAQLKIQEMAFMLLAVFLFFILVGMFVLSIVYSNIYESSNTIREERTLSSLVALADSPELSCASSKSNCIDGDKLIVLLNNSVYPRFWSFTSLKVLRLSGFNKAENELTSCTFANYPNCDIFQVYDKKVANERALSSFVALCMKESQGEYVYDRCEVARIIAGTQINFEGEN